jgi:chromosome segregation ATPase
VDLLEVGELIGGIIVAMGGGAVITLLLTLRPTKKKILSEAAKTTSEGDKTDAEAVEILARVSAGMLSPFEETVSSLARQLREAHVEIEELNRKLRAANKRVGELEDSVDTLTRRIDVTHPNPP